MSFKVSSAIKAWFVVSLTLAVGAIAAPDPTPIPTPYFSDVTDRVGLTGVQAFRIGIADVNGDGYPDLLIHIPCDEMAGDVLNKQFLYLNVPGDNPSDPHDRKFVDFTEESGIRANRQGTADGRHSSSGLFADVDNDGDVDLFTIVYLHRNYTLNLGTNDLMLNDGQGHFTLAENSTFHMDPIYNTPTAVFLDYDNDSNLDVFIGDWYFNEEMSQDHLYHGHGNGAFDDVTATCGIEGALTAVYAVAAFDWDDDGWVDIFEPSYSHTATGAQYYQWQNNHDGTFTNVAEATGYSAYGGFGSGRASFGSMPRDYDNDGKMDFFEVWTHGNRHIHSTVVTNINNNHWSWDFDRIIGREAEDPFPQHDGDHFASWFDIENDGLSDYVITESGYSNNRLYVFKQEADHTFHAVTPDSGLQPINDANLPPNNAAPFDYDLDGSEDLIVGYGADGLSVWHNDAGQYNNWITLTLDGAGTPGHSNRSAAGARVRVTAGGITQTRDVYAGNGHQCPQTPLSLHFGLGQATIVDSISIRWPNATLSTVELHDVAINQFLTIHENPSAVQPQQGVQLLMPATHFAPGEKCWLSAYLYNNQTTLVHVPVVVVLDVLGSYWFWDGWTNDFDSVAITLPTGATLLPILPEFEWPATGNDSFDGIVFWGAMLDASGTNVLGGADGIAQWTFGYGPNP